MSSIKNPTVSWYSKAAFTGIFGKRLRVIRSLQEAIGEVMMARFISGYTDNKWLQENEEDVVSRIINAYIYFVGLPCILSVYGEKIMKDKLLDAYFSQFKLYQEYKAAKQKGELKQPSLSTWLEFFGLLFRTLGIEYGLSLIFECVGSPGVAMQLIYGDLPEDLLGEESNPIKLADWLNQHYQNREWPLELCNVPEWLWLPVNPFIHLDMAVISAYVHLLFTYRSIRLPPEPEEEVPPWIKGQLVKILADSQEIAIKELDADGWLTAEIPKQPGVKKAVLDSFGLKIEVPLITEWPFKVYNASRQHWITWETPEYIQVKYEPGWTYIMSIEDQDGDPDCDWSYDNVIIKILEKETTLYVEIYGTQGADRNQVYYKNRLLCECPPEGYDPENPQFKGEIDKETGEPISS